MGGWSDHFAVSVTVTTNDKPLGPYNVTVEEFEEIMRKGREAEKLLPQKISKDSSSINLQ